MSEDERGEWPTEEDVAHLPDACRFYLSDGELFGISDNAITARSKYDIRQQVTDEWGARLRKGL